MQKFLFLCKQLRKFPFTSFNYTEVTTYFHSISFEDTRLQNYLKYLKDQYSNSHFENKELYSYESLKHIILRVKDIETLNGELKELSEFISELKEKRDGMVTTAEIEREDIEKKLSMLKSDVLNSLIPDEVIDNKDIIMELTPGVGGQEAMLFNKDMFNMYCNFTLWKGWDCEILKYDDTGIGGLRSGHIAVSGKNAFKILKYESGVHRVQRIPKTDKAGRIHTSTMTVAVLPQPAPIDININPKDIEIEFKRSSGAGGQHVNTTDSCVRLRHKPTGLIVENQVERCQHRNRILAMKSLRAKLYEKELESNLKEKILNRKLQVGTSARSEKVRTYNFVQDRITDHRAHINLHGIDSFFSGGELLNKLLVKLEEWNSINTLYELLEKYKSI